MGYQQSKYDYSLFINKSSTDTTLVAIYVDDIMITGSNTSEISHLKQQLNTLFGIKDLGQLHYFLGLEVIHTAKDIILSQKKFTNELLRDFGSLSFAAVSTPLPLNWKLNPDDGDLLPNPFLYRTLVGKLNFLTHIRPDLSYTAQTLNQFM